MRLGQNRYCISMLCFANFLQVSRIRHKGTNNTFISEFARSSLFTKITNDQKFYAFYFDCIDFNNSKHLSFMLTYCVMRKNTILNLQVSCVQHKCTSYNFSFCFSFSSDCVSVNPKTIPNLARISSSLKWIKYAIS